MSCSVLQGTPASRKSPPVCPWTWATLPFLVALMGWMPAPIEISALNSLWIQAKERKNGG